jgi:hypothetical protein
MVLLLLVQVVVSLLLTRSEPVSCCCILPAMGTQVVYWCCTQSLYVGKHPSPIPGRGVISK